MTSLCPQERVCLVAIATNLLVSGYVLFRHLELSGSGALEGADATMTWARMVLWAVPVTIGLTVGLNVLVAAMVGDGKCGAPPDERDRLFRLRGMSTTGVVFGFGFLGSLIGLATGWAPLYGIISIYVAATVADLVGNFVRLLCYRMSV